MKRIHFCLSGIFILLNFCFNSYSLASNNIGTIVKEKRTVGFFSEISVSSGCNLVLIHGKEQKVVAEAEERYLDYIKTKVVNDRLQISIDGNFINKENFQVSVTIDDLSLLLIEEGSDVRTDSVFIADEITVECFGGSDAEIDMHANKLQCDIRDGSDIKLSGEFEGLTLKALDGSDIKANIKTDNLTIVCRDESDVYCEGKSIKFYIEASGQSDVDASKLLAENCYIFTEDIVDVEVDVSDEINISAKNDSDITIKGNPKTKKIIASDDSNIRYVPLSE